MSGWAPLEVFNQQDRRVGATGDLGQQLGEKMEDSQPTTRKIGLSPYGYALNRAAQRFHLRLWYPPDGLQAWRGWKSGLEP